MANLDSIFKSKDITLLTKVHLVKAMVFPVVMYGCESWTVKKAEHQRIDAFELWCWRRLLRDQTLVAGKDRRWEKKGRQRMRWLGGTSDSTGMSLSKLWELVSLQHTVEKHQFFRAQPSSQSNSHTHT